MKKFTYLVLILALVPVFTAFSKKAERRVPLQVGVTFSPPYVFMENGSLSGVSVDLWRIISDSIGLEYKFHYYKTFDSIMEGLITGKIDLSICPYTVTTERLKKYKLTLPFYISNMGIATRIDKTSPFIQLTQHLLSWNIMRWLFLILAIATLFAIIIWLAERRHNSGQFRSGIKGVLDGIWWAFVTMTTVGYGDKIPRTILGKILAILWMFFAIALFFVAAGVVSSQLTVSTLQSEIKNTNDLTSCKVGVLYKTGYEETLERNKIPHIIYNTVYEGLTAVQDGSIDAFVEDQTIMKYILSKYYKKNVIAVFPSNLNLQYFCFLVSSKNPGLVDKINPVLLKAIDDDSWEEILDRYDVR